MIGHLGEEPELGIVGRRCSVVRYRVELVTPGRQSTDFFLEVRQAVGIPDTRHAGHDSFDGFGHHVLMKRWNQWNVRARQTCDLPGPETRTDSHLFAVDRTR